MSNVLDPSIDRKISKMNERLLWQHPILRERGIDQTRFALDDGQADDSEFSFLVIGDSGSGPHADHHPQRRIAEQMLPHHADCRFLLHTGDVIYQVGAREQYLENFIKPYREFLVGGAHPDQIPFDRMIFHRPFLPVLGNHDYYNVPFLYWLAFQGMRVFYRLTGRNLRIDIGWQGSQTGNAFTRAFLDPLKLLQSSNQLSQHLDRHYTAPSDTGRCLRYQPGLFTRLPNRYYTFRYGGIDFFALDSSTLNAPSSLPHEQLGDRQLLTAQYQDLQQQEQQIRDEASHLNLNLPEGAERIDDLHAKLEQLEEMKLDIEKQLATPETTEIDIEQMVWLQRRLIESWQNPEVRGRIIYFHHPPYVTEITKWHQGQTLAVRHHLRWVLDRVADAVGEQASGRSLVDLILNGHAHCFEYLRTMDTGHADSHLNWIVCGGSGLSLRRQRPEGAELYEDMPPTQHSTDLEARLVAKSQVFIGLSGHKLERRRPYSFLRIDVKPGCPPTLIVRPFISERYHQTWSDRALEPLVL
ncbi:MAG TPA: metallophosphoesterase family protein [Elainellaceae cyanobacterium]